MTITFPDDLRETLERETREAGMPSVDVYVLAMYARAEHSPEQWGLDPAARQQWLALAEAGLKSSPLPDPRGFLANLVRDTAATAGGSAPQ